MKAFLWWLITSFNSSKGTRKGSRYQRPKRPVEWGKWMDRVIKLLEALKPLLMACAVYFIYRTTGLNLKDLLP